MPFVSPRRMVISVLGFAIVVHYFSALIFRTYTVVPNFKDIGARLGWSSNHRKTVFLPSSTITITETSHCPTSIPLLPTPASPAIAEKDEYDRANATFVFLCRNSDLEGVVTSIQQMEDRFNRKRGYPWVLLNEEPFTDEFKMRVQVLTDAPIHFGVIPAEHWYQPSWINETAAEERRKWMVDADIIYGGSVPYRNMCRFNSGFFFHHELMKPYRYYWRVEPEVKFYCDINDDPFKFMEKNDKVYGFTIAILEIQPTVANLWPFVKEFITQNPQYVSPDNAMGFISDDQGDSYNLCHYWSNFEIADMDFWRGEAYQKYFEYLDATGGFYYERWGDAPVHSIAAALFARKDQLHFFRNIGYQHDSVQHCPLVIEEWQNGRCACNPYESSDYDYYSCLEKYEAITNG